MGGSELQTRVTFEPNGVTGRTACPREGLSEPDDVDNRAGPLCALSEVKKGRRAPVSWPAVFRRSRFQKLRVPHSESRHADDKSPVSRLYLHTMRKTNKTIKLVVKKREQVNRKDESELQKECNTRTSQGVTHPSTTLAQARLTSEF